MELMSNMRKFECNQFYEDTGGRGEQRCTFRCKLIKFDIIEKGNKLKGYSRREQVRGTTENVCRLKKNQSKICSHKNDSERTCNIPKCK